MIPIPEELAKRVLEALERGANAASMCSRLIHEDPNAKRGQYIVARREHDLIAVTRDELAALLTPKEAT